MAGMGHVVVSDLAYAHPGGDLLFADVSFQSSPGDHVGPRRRQRRRQEHAAADPRRRAAAPTRATSSSAGASRYMPQDVGVGDDARTVRELLLVAGARARCATRASAMLAAERAARGGRRRAPACALGDGDRRLVGRSAATSSRASGTPPAGGSSRAAFDERRPTAPAVTLSGGERKRLVLDVLFASDADVLLLDEPDNFLDVPAKRALERADRARSKKTVLLISHDRELLTGAVRLDPHARGQRRLGARRLLRDLPEARERAPAAGSATRSSAGSDEERRLFAAHEDVQGARAYSPRLGQEGRRRRDALAALRRRRARRRRRSSTSTIKVRLRGGDSARRVLDLRALGDRRARLAVHRRGPLRRARRAASAPTARARRT